MAKKEANKENKVKKHFFKDLKAELKKVIWPTPKQLVNNTVAVITIVLITAAIVFALDVVFDMMNKHGISKLQNYVSETFTTEETNTTENNTTNSSEENTTTENNTTSEGENTENTVENESQENENTVE